MKPRTTRWRYARWVGAACLALGLVSTGALVLLFTGSRGSPPPIATPSADLDRDRAVAVARHLFDQAFADEYRRRARIDVGRTDNGWWRVAFQGVDVPCRNTQRAPVGQGMCGRNLARPDEELAYEDFYVCVDPRDLTPRFAGPGSTC